MDTSRPAASNNPVIDALVLAYSHSGARHLQGTSALRGLLEAPYAEPPANGTLDLEPAWQLLERQPGFDASAATAAMCRVKLWEPLLGMSVALPAALAHMGPPDILLRATSCSVPSTAVQRVFRGNSQGADPISSSPDALSGIPMSEHPSPLPGDHDQAASQAPAPMDPWPSPESPVERRRRASSQLQERSARSTLPPGERSARSTMPPGERSARSTLPPGERSARSTLPLRPSSQRGSGAIDVPPSSTRRAVIQMAAAVVAVLSFSFAGMSLYRGCQTSASWTTMELEGARGLPLTRVERIGNQVRGVLDSESWLEQPEPQRNAALEEALRALEPKGVTVLFLEDSRGQVRATAQLYADGAKIRFMYR